MAYGAKQHKTSTHSNSTASTDGSPGTTTARDAEPAKRWPLRIVLTIAVMLVLWACTGFTLYALINLPIIIGMILFVMWFSDVFNST